jgi:hypothetical protein
MKKRTACCPFLTLTNRMQKLFFILWLIAHGLATRSIADINKHVDKNGDIICSNRKGGKIIDLGSADNSFDGQPRTCIASQISRTSSLS